MSNYRITIRISQDLQKRIAELMRQSGKTESEIACEAIEEYLQRQPTSGETAYDSFLAAGLIGDAEGLPPDLSTNPSYMEGFGRD